MEHLYILLFFAFHWYASLFFQTFYLHRYAAHAMFKMSKFWEWLFNILTFIFQGSSYLSPYAYGILHRMHHQYADTPNDPHSPIYDKNIFRMMWKTKLIYNAILEDRYDADPSIMETVPPRQKVDYIGDWWPIRVAWGTAYALVYVFYAPHWAYFFLLPIHFLMGPVHGAVINWYAHRIGYTNHEVSDTSKNLMPWDLIMFGEGLHNNHHKWGGRPKFANKWWEFDPAYPIIWTFNLLHIIRFKKGHSPEAIF